MHALCRTFFPVLALQQFLKSVKIWQSWRSQITLLRFMNHDKNVGFNFSRYGAHINRVNVFYGSLCIIMDINKVTMRRVRLVLRRVTVRRYTTV